MSALGLGSAAALAGLFIAQVTLAVAWQGDEARTVASLTWLGWGYIALAALIAAANFDRLKLLKTGFLGERRSPIPQRSQ